MSEIWKPVPGYVGFYEASNQGNVRRVGKTKYLSSSKNKDGYLQILLCVKGIRKNTTIHQVVAGAFLGPCPKGMIVRHIDGSRGNNIPDNLQYGTNKENSEDMVKHDTQAKGSSQGLSKLTEENILYIRNSEKKQQELADEFGIRQSNVSLIRSRKTWKHI